MALTPEPEKRLDSLHRNIRSGGKHPHHGLTGDYIYAIRIFIEQYQAGEPVSPDDVREWAIGKKWSDEHARDLGEMADTMNHTMRILGY